MPRSHHELSTTCGRDQYAATISDMSSNDGWSAQRMELTSNQNLTALTLPLMPAALRNTASVSMRTLAFSSRDRPALSMHVRHTNTMQPQITKRDN